MKGIRLRFLFWLMGWIILFLVANIQLRPFPHILLIFWTLLPVLSLFYSYLSGKKVSRTEELAPKRLFHGETGEWILHLSNGSRWMPFFLRVPIARPDSRRQITEIMLNPGSGESLSFPFEAAYTGVYTFHSGEPIFEDLLGFFILQTGRGAVHTAQCIALPREVHEMPSFSTSLHAQDEGSTSEKRSLLNVSEEIFSIDPISQGESLAHAHWKLSARMGKWMIKHYSDFEQEPIRMLVDVEPVEFDGAAHFAGSKQYTSPQTAQALEQRTAFLDMFYTQALDYLRRGYAVDVGDRYSQLVHARVEDEAEVLGTHIAQLPFYEMQRAWRLNPTQERKQQIWIQRIDDATLGSLLNYDRLGVAFVIVSIRGNHTDKQIAAIENSVLDCVWLDEA